MTNPMPNSTGEGTLPLGLIVGSIVGLLLLIVLGVVIVTLLTYMLKCRKVRGKYSARRANGVGRFGL